MEKMNGCNARLIITVGSLCAVVGELEEKPGQYKAWLQEGNGGAPIWERPFEKLNHAAGFLCETALPKRAGKSA